MEGPITGIVTMEPEQRRILDREEGEREREIGDLFACNRSRV